MPPARRRSAQQLIEDGVTAAINEIGTQDDDLAKVTVANAFTTQLDEQRRRLALPRLRPVAALHESGWSFERLAEATGLSKNAIR